MVSNQCNNRFWEGDFEKMKEEKKVELSKQKMFEITKCERNHYSGLYCLCCHFVLDKDHRGNFYCKKCGAKIGVLR